MAFSTLFAILAAHGLLETARNALFLAKLPVERLPWVYLAIVIVALPLSRRQQTLEKHATHAHHFLSRTVLASSALTFIFWLLVLDPNPGSWIFFALYAWSGVLVTVILLRFWLTMGALYTLSQAKRLYGIIGAGGVLGSIAGAAIARVVAEFFPASDLVLSAAIALLPAVLSSLLLRCCKTSAEKQYPQLQSGSRSLVQDFGLISDSPYLRRVAILVGVAAISSTLADFLFKSIVVQHVRPQNLGAFFADVDIVLGTISLLVQIFAVSWFLRHTGLARTLCLLPTLLIAGGISLFLVGGLIAALALRGTDGSLKHTLHQTAIELLFVPVAESYRARARTFISVFGQRGGQALASMAILGSLSWGLGEKQIVLIFLALTSIWVWSAFSLRPHYMNLFRDALKKGRIETRIALPPLDLASLETLTASLGSTNDDEVITALDLLVEQDKVSLIPRLIIYHPSHIVVERAITHFIGANRTDFLPLTERLLTHTSPDVRAIALRAHSTIDPDPFLLRDYLEDPSPSVKATALASLIAHGWIRSDSPDRTALQETTEFRVAFCRAIALQASPIFESILLDLAQDHSTRVQIEVVRAMGVIGSYRFLPHLLSMLGVRKVRHAARKALVAFGDEALVFLTEMMSDASLPAPIRRHLPRTISKFPPTQAAKPLLDHLLRESSGLVRFKILRGLVQLRRRDPNVQLNSATLDQALRQTLRRTYQILRWRRSLEEQEKPIAKRLSSETSSAVSQLLITLMSDKENLAIERIFYLLGLRYPNDDFRRIYLGFQSDQELTRASSRELLENLLDSPLREAILGLSLYTPDNRRLQNAGPYYSGGDIGYVETIAAILRDGGESLQCLAAYQAGELHLSELRGQLEQLAEDGSVFLSEIIAQSINCLDSSDSRQL